MYEAPLPERSSQDPTRPARVVNQIRTLRDQIPYVRHVSKEIPRRPEA
jgi:hypothetical protein